MTANLSIKRLSSKIVYENKWIKIHEDTTLMPNGREGTYGYLEANDGVHIVPIDKDGRACMVYGFRYPSQSWGWGFPAGNSDGEMPDTAAKRELIEETGIIAEKIEPLGKTLYYNGLASTRQHTFVAYGLNIGGKPTDDNEAISAVKFFSLEEIERMIEKGTIDSNESITAFYFVKRWLAKRRQG